MIKLYKMTNRIILLIFSFTLLSFTSNSSEEQKMSNEEITKMAEQAYYYGLQQAIFYGQRWIYTQDDSKDNVSYSGVNRLYNVRKKITPDFPVVTPNATTLYGTGFMDLSDGPVILELPEVTDRYFTAQLMDQYGIFHTMVGSPFNGTAARKYIFVPQDYKGKIPAEFSTIDVIYWPSKTAYCIIRVALMEGSEKEIAIINSYQDKMILTPLKEWLENGNKGVSQADRAIVKGNYAIPKVLPEIARGQVDKQTAEDYFSLLNTILNDPTMTLMFDSCKEKDMLNQLATIGIGPGKDFKWDDLDPETQKALSTGFKSGFDSVRKSVKNNLINLNGWMEVRNSGGFETAWLDRAIMADIGWAGPDVNVSHTGAFLFTDSDKAPLNGANKYTITFDRYDLPPVDEFWSIPIYNKDGYFVANEIDRYTINSFMIDQGQLDIKNGKIVIYVQHEKPTDLKKLKNWLPAPEGAFRFTARFYHPKMSIIDGSYKMPVPVKDN